MLAAAIESKFQRLVIQLHPYCLRYVRPRITNHQPNSLSEKTAMPACRVVFARLALTASAIAFLAGCAATPMGPIVQAVPGPGKPFAVSQADQSSCKAFAADQVSGQVQASNQTAVGTAALTTVAGAGL